MALAEDAESARRILQGHLEAGLVHLLGPNGIQWILVQGDRHYMTPVRILVEDGGRSLRCW